MAAAASYWAMLAVLIALTVADAVLCTIMFDMFTERYAIFLNQATAFVYIVVASILLLGRRFFLDASHGGNRTPWLALIAIGLFNGTGNCRCLRSMVCDRLRCVLVVGGLGPGR